MNPAKFEPWYPLQICSGYQPDLRLSTFFMNASMSTSTMVMDEFEYEYIAKS